MSICIVADDSKVIRGIITKILSNLGFKVICADNGDAVLDLYSKMNGEVSLIVMDYKLPGLDGIDVLYKIKAKEAMENKKTFIILSSSITNEAKISEVLEGGADDYLMKPFDEDILSSKLEYLGVI